MTDPTYRCRPSILDTEVTWTLTPSALESSTGARVPFDQVATVRLYGFATSVLGSRRLATPATRRCVITPVRGKVLALTSSHFLSLGRFEDRAAIFEPFVDTLLRRIRARSPRARLLRGLPPALWWVWCAIGVGCGLVGAFGVIIVMVELWTKRHMSLEVLVLLPLVAGMLISTHAILRLLRTGRSRPFDPG